MKLLLFTFTCLLATNVYCQETLDVEKLSECELFTEKKDYDIASRISEIEKLEGQEVTVFKVKGKDNKVKYSYTGNIKNQLIDNSKLSDKANASVIIVQRVENGKIIGHLPLTDNKSFRIYLTGCLQDLSKK